VLARGVLRYLLPTPCGGSVRSTHRAEQTAGQLAPGYEQVIAISEWARTNSRYTPLGSTFPVSAAEVNQRSEGVCRDLAHVGIALCRALCIPARLAVGYLHELDPMDNHAWFEAYVGGEWIAVDPTAASQTGWRITVAYGRDAADVALYNQYGPLLLPTELHVSVERQECNDKP